MTEPTPPVAFSVAPDELVARISDHAVASDELVAAVAATSCEVLTGDAERAEAGRDWWPLAIGWAQRGQVPTRPGLVARPSSTEQVASLLALANERVVPVTPAAGRSGVCGGSIPTEGGIALDLTAMAGLVELDDTSLIATFWAGTFGPDVERILGEHGLTLGHWPQSMDLSTIGGWAACRGAGQYSTRYGKIEDLVVGLEVVLASGEVITTGGRGPRQAVGPDLNQLFVGSEGTLGVITKVSVRVAVKPSGELRRAYSFASFEEGLEACRRILRRGGRPAVLRLYDEVESKRNFDLEANALIVLDEADPAELEATAAIVDAECAGATPEDVALVERWLGHRNDVSGLQPLWQNAIVVDTIEVAGPWAALPATTEAVLSALRAVPGTLLASVHQSHAYPDGACLYYTFAGRPEDESGIEPYYVAAWDAAQRAAIASGASLSHHHGVGLHRARFVADALGGGLGVLAAVKAALDPKGILNPGKLGLGEARWP